MVILRHERTTNTKDATADSEHFTHAAHWRLPDVERAFRTTVGGCGYRTRVGNTECISQADIDYANYTRDTFYVGFISSGDQCSDTYDCRSNCPRFLYRILLVCILALPIYLSGKWTFGRKCSCSKTQIG